MTDDTRPVVARLAAGLTALIGLVVLIGWAMDIPGLKTVLVGGAEMKANTALGLLFGGVALLARAGRHGSWHSGLGTVLAFVVILLGVTTGSQTLFGWQLGID